MASIETAIATRLLNTTDIVNLVGDRVYADSAVARRLPRILITTPTQGHEHDLSGSASGLTTATIQLSCDAENHIARRKLGEACRNALDGYMGTSDTYVIRGCTLTFESLQFAELKDAGTGGVYSVIQQYEVTHRESLPSGV